MGKNRDDGIYRHMISRFRGDAAGERRLMSALLEQTLVRGNDNIAAAFAAVLELKELQPGEVLIHEGAADNDVYLILTGKVTIRIKGRDIACREAGTHVGEMAMIDAAAKRSATVLATETTVLAKITEPAFTKIAAGLPDLWRRLAIEVSNRLRQRSKYIKAPNLIPRLFLGCSTERLGIAQEIQNGLAHDPLEVTIWTDGVFRPSGIAVGDLLACANRMDFAALIVGAEDNVICRGEEIAAPRDNVILELGMSMGVLSRERTFIIRERGVVTKIPSDLIGVTPIEFDTDSAKSLASRIGPVCTVLRNTISRLGPK